MLRRHELDRADKRDGRHVYGLDFPWFVVPADVRCWLHRVGPSDVQQRHLHQQCDVRRVPGAELLRGRVCTAHHVPSRELLHDRFRNARPVLERDSLHGRVRNARAVPGGKLLHQFERVNAVPRGELLR